MKAWVPITILVVAVLAFTAVTYLVTVAPTTAKTNTTANDTNCTVVSPSPIRGGTPPPPATCADNVTTPTRG